MAKARLEGADGKVQDSIQVLQGVLKDAPENARAHYYLAQAYRQSGNSAGAKSEIQEAVKREPDNTAFPGVAHRNLS